MHALAFENLGEWTVVTWNEGSGAASYGLKVPGAASVSHVVVTNESKSLVDGDVSLRTDSGAWLVQAPAENDRDLHVLRVGRRPKSG